MAGEDDNVAVGGTAEGRAKRQRDPVHLRQEIREAGVGGRGYGCGCGWVCGWGRREAAKGEGG